MGIPPIVGPGGENTCPAGYGYDSGSGLCLPTTPPVKVTVTGQDPSQNWSITDINEAQVDPKVAAQAAGLGWLNDGLIERFVTAILHGIILLVQPLLTLWISVQDAFYAGIAELLTAAQGEKGTGFYELSAALVSDLFGVEISGDDLAKQYNSGGRLAAVSLLGKSIVNILAAEFMGVYQSSGATGYSVPDGQGIGGLPVATMSPAQGVKAAQAFLGFATEFGVREGNAELVAASIPHGLGEGVREMAVSVARGVNLSRLGRVALMPLFKGLVATPLQWAINQQYRPTLLDPAEAVAAHLIAGQGNFDVSEELSRHGYSDAKIGWLTAIHTKTPSWSELNTLSAAGIVTDTDIALFLGRERWDTQGVSVLRQSSDLLPARDVCLAIAKKYVTEYVEGSKPLSDVADLLASLPFLTKGEVSALNQVVSSTAALNAKLPKIHMKRIDLSQWKKAFYAGIVSLGDLETAIAQHYPDPNEAQIVLLEDLLGQVGYDVQQERLAAAAAKLGISVPGLPKL